MKWVRGLRSGTPRKNKLRITVEMLCTAFQLTGDDGAFAARAVINDFQQVGSRTCIQGCQRPVIQNQHVRLGQLQQPFAKAAGTMQNPQLLSQSRRAHVGNRVSTPAGVLPQCTSQPGLAATSGTIDDHRVPRLDPVTQRQTGDLAPLHTTPTTRVHVFDRGLRVLQAGQAQ